MSSRARHGEVDTGIPVLHTGETNRKKIQRFSQTEDLKRVCLSRMPSRKQNRHRPAVVSLSHLRLVIDSFRRVRASSLFTPDNADVTDKKRFHFQLGNEYDILPAICLPQPASEHGGLRT